MALAHCSHCGTSFTPDNGVSVDDCPVCGRAVEVKPAPAPLPKVVAEALRRFAQDCPTCTDTVHNHISDLTRRLAEAEARVRELEAFKARVMAWARGRCECCKNNNPENGACPDDCYPGHITAWVNFQPATEVNP